MTFISVTKLDLLNGSPRLHPSIFNSSTWAHHSTG